MSNEEKKLETTALECLMTLIILKPSLVILLQTMITPEIKKKLMVSLGQKFSVPNFF